MKRIFLSIALFIYATHCNEINNGITNTLTQSTVNILREYEVPHNAHIKIKAKNEPLDIYMFESATAAQEILKTDAHEKILKPLVALLSPLLSLFTSPSKIILKAEVSLFGAIEEPFTIQNGNGTFVIELTHNNMINCTIIAPVKHMLIVETNAAINFSSQYAAVDAYAHNIVVNASHPFTFKSNPKDLYQNAVGILNTLSKVYCEPTQVVLRSDNGVVKVNELLVEKSN